MNSVTTYANAGSLTYALVGGSYYDQSDNRDRHCLMVGEDQTTDGITSDKIYGLDLADNGKLTFQLDTEATKPAVIERVGIDMDEAGSGATNYLVVTRFYPQVDTTNTTDTTMTFEFGASDIPRMSRPTRSAVTFDIATDHKIDSRAAGRYLSYKVTFTHNAKTSVQSGFDIDVTPDRSEIMALSDRTNLLVQGLHPRQVPRVGRGAAPYHRRRTTENRTIHPRWLMRPSRSQKSHRTIHAKEWCVSQPQAGNR